MGVAVVDFGSSWVGIPCGTSTLTGTGEEGASLSIE